MAESAHRAGYAVVTIDGFADLDTVAVSSECWCLPLVEGEFDSHKFLTCLTKVRARYPVAAVIAGAGSEACIDAIAMVPGWCLLGNSATSVQQVCAPTSFFAALDRLSIPYPARETSPPSIGSAKWLYKTPFRCGGMGVQKNATELGADGYWQRELDGLPISAICLSQAGRAQLIGINRQYTIAMGSHLPYVYSGALANYEIGQLIYDKLVVYINKLINYFQLTGLCSVDMLIHDDELYVLEINPRVSATYELYQRLQPQVNLIDAHISVCEGASLPPLAFDDGQCAYAIVYADDRYVVPAMDWPKWCSDRPERGRILNRCDPICTAWALSGEGEDLYNRARQKGQQILSLIKQSIKNTN